MANIELPKDAEGREIPLDTVALFSSDGNVLNIVRWIYTTDFDLKDDLANSWSAIDDIGAPINPELMYLTPPDSWEKLEEDLEKAWRMDLTIPRECSWYNNGRWKCGTCKAHNGAADCSRRMMHDILSRIHKLRGES